MAVKGDSLYIEAIGKPRATRSSKKSRGRSAGRGKHTTGRSSKAMKSVKSLMVNFLAVMIFVSVAVILLARFGG
jgi:hypothetical protein